MLIVNQLVDNIQEVFIPLIKTYRLNKDYEMSRKKSDVLPTIAKINYEKRRIPGHCRPYTQGDH